MSTQKLPTFRIKNLEPIGNELFIALPDLQDYDKSYLEADAAVGATTLSAAGLNFATDNYIVLGEIGKDKTEIVKVTSVTATTIVCAATVYAHSRGDSIRFIPYNQIIVESSALGVVYVPESAFGISINTPETYIQYATQTTAYSYKFRFYNSTSTKYSSYSSIITSSTYADNSLYSVKKRAMGALGEKVDELITDEYLNDSLREARRAVDMDPRILRWSFRSIFNYELDFIIPGTYRMALPIDLRDRFTNKNILGLRVAKQSYVVEYQDNLRFRQNYYNKPHGILNVAALFGDITLSLESTANFDASGAIVVSGDYDTEYSTISYTGNDVVTGTLTGVTGIPAAGLKLNSDVWQNTTFGVPRAYTIENGYIYFDLPFDNASMGTSVFIDYYKNLTELTSDISILDEPFFDLYVSYLKYAVKYKKSNGKLERDADSDFKDWTEGITKLIGQELMGQTVRFVPTISNRFSGMR